MNPYGIQTPAPIDLLALARWNAANQHCREEYHVTLARHQGLCTRPECEQKAGVALLCNRCRYAKAKGMIS